MNLIKTLCCIFSITLFTSYTFAQNEDDLDAEFLSDESSSVSEALTDEAKWEIFGYFKNDNQFLNGKGFFILVH